jgi:stage V sporulation protein B
MNSTDMPVSVATQAPPAPTAAVRRGTSLLTSGGALVLAKVVFVAAGYVIYAGLPRLLSPSQFGTFLVVNSAVGVLNAVFVSGTIQAVSRFVAQRPESAAGTLRTALRLQCALAGVLGGLYLLLAPVIASALNDAMLTPYLRVSAVIPIAYALYAAHIGYANGLRRFGQQAGFDMAYSAAKIALVIALPWLGYGAFGAVAGFAAASVLILVLAWLRIGQQAVHGPASPVTAATMLRFEAAVMAHVAFTNLLMQLDLLMVKGLYPAADASAAAAMYGAAAKLAQIPYSVLVALNFLIYPYIARSTAESAGAETAGYIRHALRLGAALVVGPAIVLVAVSAGAVSLVFGPDYASAAPVLVVLAGGYVVFALLTMVATIINSAGRPGISLGITGGTVAAQAMLARLLIPMDGIVGGAIASSAAYLLGLAVATTYLVSRFGNVLPWASFGRIAVAAALVVAAAQTVLRSTPVLIAAPLLGASYLLVLILLREWTAADLKHATARTSPAD